METREEHPERKIKTFELSSDNPKEGDVLIVVYGDFDRLNAEKNGTLVRLHSRCLYGDVLDSLDCDCGPQLRASQEMMQNEGGVLFYLKDQEGRGAGLLNKARGYELTTTEGVDTAEAYERLGLPFDQREYGHCASFLKEHGIVKVRLLSNNPRKVAALENAGLEVEQVNLVVGVNDINREYLRTKRDKAGHTFPKDI